MSNNLARDAAEKSGGRHEEIVARLDRIERLLQQVLETAFPVQHITGYSTNVNLDEVAASLKRVVEP